MYSVFKYKKYLVLQLWSHVITFFNLNYYLQLLFTSISIATIHDTNVFIKNKACRLLVYGTITNN